MIPYYSLIVLAYNNWKFTNQCLSTLLESLDEAHIEKGVEIIVVDNGSNQATKQQMSRFGKKHKNHKAKLQFVMLKENLGYPSGMNIGFEHSKGEIIAVLNNDLLFPKNWLNPLVQLLELQPKIGFAAPFMSYAAGSIQHVAKTFDTFEEMEQFSAYFTNLNKHQVVYVDKIIGACLVFRRNLLVTIGGNDFWYGIGNFDDVDWCLRARIAGYTIAVVGESFVHHIGHASFLQEPVQFNSSLQINQDKFERKWGIKNHDPNDPTHEKVILKFEARNLYIPFQIANFNMSDVPFFPRNSSHLRLLLCADWCNPQSEWAAIIRTLWTKYEEIELCCWIPARIFDVNLIHAQLNVLIGSLPEKASHAFTSRIFHEEVPYTDTIRVLRSADSVVRVTCDYVNRYIIYLAEQLSMDII
jgi:GT2 family glycosyltransferase